MIVSLPLLISVILFIVLNILLLITVNQTFNTFTPHNKDLPVSIIIAAKNEENNIRNLIKALKEIDYPADNFEVIIIDDNSNDGTLPEIQKSIENSFNFKVLKAENKLLPGKKGALEIAIGKAKFPFILITDADCIPPRNWIDYFAGKFSEGYHFLFGHAPFYQDKQLVNKISCFENLRNSILTFSACTLGIPYSASARNMGFKVESFKKLQGYLNTSETLSGDDDLLLREAVKHKMKIGVVTNKNSFVYSYTKTNFKDYFDQKSRHIKSSLHYLPSRQLLLAFWHLINIAFVFGIIFSVWYPPLIVLFFVKIITDLVIIKSSQSKFGYDFSTVQIVFYQLFFEALIIINFIISLLRKDKWK